MEPVHASTFSDPAGDFEGTYTGPANADLDILSGRVSFDAETVYLSSRMNGTVGDTVGSLYLWGINRGAGSLPFLAPGAPTVFLDTVVRLGSDGTGFITYFPAGGPPGGTPLAADLISVNGNRISIALPRSLLPSTGFAFEDFTYNHWSRSAPGPETLIADVAPRGTSLVAGAIPEPGTWALLIAGFGVVGAAARRRRPAVHA